MEATVDFESAQSHLLLNPRMPAEARARLEALVPELPAHVFVATSGTTGAIKLVALSKQAILASARAVNERLAATGDDVWCRVLPYFHVGGLGIHARAHLSGARMVAMPWDARAFAATEATLTSLVPAQVHDLVAAGLRPPRTLRAVLVGGGAFDPDLQGRGHALGWPLLATYGMSECCSTVTVENELLPHLEARSEPDGRLAVRGTSLFTGYATEGGLVDPKLDGWFLTEDFGEVDGRTVRVRGRAVDFVKIGGESVDLNRLDAILRYIAGDAAAVVAVADARLGHVIHLASTVEAESIVERFNAQVVPFERIRQTHRVDRIPRSPLGKLLRAELEQLLKVSE
ncbi:MAG TPA: AMP-binding protein [Thermoanaerobaculia bacterium]|nr:AMP-binding protein [Thermoanaerobaculia bacterium]